MVKLQMSNPKFTKALLAKLTFDKRNGNLYGKTLMFILLPELAISDEPTWRGSHVMMT